MADKENNQINTFELSREWFDWCYEHPELISTNHTALYFFIIDHYNRLGWKQKFGLPTMMAMEAIGIKSWKTYSKAFSDIVSWGFIKVIEKSKNQYSATVIALVKNTRANTKALSKASKKHGQKQYKSIVDIDIPITIEPITNNQDSSKYHSGETPVEENKIEFWRELVRVWFNFYQKKFSAKPTFNKVAAANFKNIIERIKKISKEKGFEWNEDYAKRCLLHFLEKAYSDEWLRANFILNNLSTKFDSIVNSSIDGTNQKNGKQQPGSLRAGVQEAFNRRFAGAGQPGHQPGTETV